MLVFAAVDVLLTLLIVDVFESKMGFEYKNHYLINEQEQPNFFKETDLIFFELLQTNLVTNPAKFINIEFLELYRFCNLLLGEQIFSRPCTSH